MQPLHPSGTCMRCSGWSRILMPPLPSKEDQMLDFRRPQHQRYGPERGGSYLNHLGISRLVGSTKGKKGQKTALAPPPSLLQCRPTTSKKTAAPAKNKKSNLKSSG